MKYEDVSITQGQNARKEIMNKETNRQFDIECKITLSCDSNS